MTWSELDPREAVAVVAGMLAVALCDGVADPRELALVEARRATLPYAADVSGARVGTDAARRLMLRCLHEVARADGVVVAEERETIREIARAHGVPDALLAELEAA